MSSDWVGAIAAGGTLAVIGVLVWQIFATGRTAIASGKDKEYQQLIDEVKTTQSELVEQQKQVAEHLAEVRTRLTAIEQLLRDVG